MRYEGYMIIVRDILVAKKFYEDVLQARTLLDLGKHVIFAGGYFLLQEDDWLDFSEQRKDALHYRSRTGELVFEVEDIDAFMERLSGIPNISLLHGVKEHPWGRRAVRLYDPDGHLIEVGESMEFVVKRFLREGMSVQDAANRSEFPLEFVLQCKADLDAE